MERSGQSASSVIMRIEPGRNNSLLTKEPKSVTKRLKIMPKNTLTLKLIMNGSLMTDAFNAVEEYQEAPRSGESNNEFDPEQCSDALNSGSKEMRKSSRL